MICTKWVYALLAAIALVLVSGWTAAEAQLAKSGTYTVYYAWHGKGERITAEKGQFVLGARQHTVCSSTKPVKGSCTRHRPIVLLGSRVSAGWPKLRATVGASIRTA